MMADKIFLTVLNMSLTASIVIAAVWAARLALKRAPKWISYALWAVALFNLLCPFKPQSVLSLHPFKPAPIPLDIGMQAQPRIDTGISLLNGAVSAALPAARPADSANPLQVWTAVGAYIWLIGAAAMLVYAVISYALLKRKLRFATRTDVNVYETDAIRSPFVLGFVRPKIYLPVGLAAADLEYILLHERTHIRRRDYLVKPLAFLALALHWFNPLVWLAYFLLGADMEMSCDERVLRELGGEAKTTYSAALLSLATGRRLVGLSPLAFGEGGVKGRVKNALNFRKPSRIIVLAAVVILAVVTVGFAVERGGKSGASVVATISFEGKSAVIALDDNAQIPYVELGSTISLDFRDGRPEGVSVVEIRANADGSRKYAEATDKILPLELSGYNLVTFEIASSMADHLSSNSEDYLTGNSFRWYRIICGEDEYNLWLRTDPAVLWESIEPAASLTEFEVTPNPDRYTHFMSSAPGILLALSGHAKGEPTAKYYCDSGEFLSWEDSVVTRLGGSAESRFGNDNLYWSPDERTKDGDGVVIWLVDERGKQLAAQTLIVRISDDFFYSLEAAAANIRRMTLADVREISRSSDKYAAPDELIKYLADNFIGEDIGSGFWIMRFGVEDGKYQLTAHQAGGLSLTRVTDGASIDLLYYDLDAFLAGKIKQIRETPSPVETTPPAKKYVAAAPAAWSPDMSLGATGVPSLDYASDKYIILHSYFGMFVYDLESRRIIRSLDLAAIGCQYTQGSDYCEVVVSADGGKVFLRTMETRKMYIWDLTAEQDLSLYLGDFERGWPEPNERFRTVSVETAVGAAYSGAQGLYSYRAADFGKYYGYLYASNGENIGGLWYCVADMIFSDLFSERTSTALAFLAEPYAYGTSAKEITAVLTNNTFNEKDVICGDVFAIERLYRGDWVSVPLKDGFGWNLIAYFLPVGESKTYAIKTEWLKEPLEPGSYRVSTDVLYGEAPPKNKTTVYAEFAVRG